MVQIATDYIALLKDYAQGMLKPVVALFIVGIAISISIFQKLGIGREMAYAIFRAFLQLSIIGFVLQFIFTQQNVAWIILAHLFMVAVAGYTAGQRAKHVPNGKYIAGASMLVGTSITMALLVLMQVFPFTPRYIIPVSGMVVGNSMTVTGITLKRLRDDVRVQQNLAAITSSFICNPDAAERGDH